MVWDDRALEKRGLGGADIEPAIDCAGIGGDDLGVYPTSQFE
jgi:hypothetical protein